MKKNIIFYSIIILLIIAKLYLISSLPINAEYTTILDDALFVKQANSIAEGRWLGDYDNTTLIKGVFMPLFIVVLYIFKIPYIIGQELFYSLACVLFITIIKDKVKSKPILIIIFTILLLNPVTYSTELCRIYRDGVYASLILYLVSFTYAIFLKREEPAKKLIKYFIGLGFSFSAIYLCREETIWIMPFVIIATIITIAFMIKQKKKLLLYLIPTGMLTISILTVCSLNYKYYGVFELNQYWNTSFKSAYGALTRVTPEQRKERVPVTRETLKRIYEISPKFNELKVVTYDGEVWDPTLYDLDSTWGLTWDGSSLVPSDAEFPKDYIGGESVLWSKLERCFSKEIKQRYWELRNTVLSDENIINEFTEFVNEIPQNAWEREHKMWKDIPSLKYDLKQIKQNVQERGEYLDKLMAN